MSPGDMTNCPLPPPMEVEHIRALLRQAAGCLREAEDHICNATQRLRIELLRKRLEEDTDDRWW